MERIVNNHLLNYLLENQLITKHQHGLYVKKSTCTNLLECLHDCSVNIQSRNCINFKKAFDTVSHPKLSIKLKSYGGNLLAWITDLLSNRSQCVKLGNSLSQPISVLSGVPQGSVIGPTLFLLFVNDESDIFDKLLFRSSYMLTILNCILVIMLHHPVMIYLLLSIDYMNVMLLGS